VPVIITGQCAGGDVDYFRFAGGKGSAWCWRPNPPAWLRHLATTRVTDAQRRFLAADDSQALRGDCRLSFVVPADGITSLKSPTRATAASRRLIIGSRSPSMTCGGSVPLGGRRGETVAFTLRGGTLAGEVTFSDPSWMNRGCREAWR